MTELWKAEAAKRFNERIVIRPTDLFWPQNPPEPERQPETWAELGGMIYKENQKLFVEVVDALTPRRVA